MDRYIDIDLLVNRYYITENYKEQILLKSQILILIN